MRNDIKLQILLSIHVFSLNSSSQYPHTFSLSLSLSLSHELKFLWEVSGNQISLNFVGIQYSMESQKCFAVNYIVVKWVVYRYIWVLIRILFVVIVVRDINRTAIRINKNKSLKTSLQFKSSFGQKSKIEIIQCLLYCEERHYVIDSRSAQTSDTFITICSVHKSMQFLVIHPKGFFIECFSENFPKTYSIRVWKIHCQDVSKFTLFIK